jgi:hypothetical protein
MDRQFLGTYIEFLLLMAIIVLLPVLFTGIAAAISN